MLGLATGVALLAAGPAEARKHCHYVKGNGWGITPEIAKANAKMAYDVSLANYGGKARGAPYYECKSELPMQMCVAEQVACKKKK